MPEERRPSMNVQRQLRAAVGAIVDDLPDDPALTTPELRELAAARVLV